MTDNPDRSLTIDTHHHILPDFSGKRRRARMPRRRRTESTKAAVFINNAQGRPCQLPDPLDNN